jgi:hypothetical protein
MNKQVLSHCGWAVVAITSFVVGSQFSSDDNSDPASSSSQSPSSVSVRAGSSGDGPGDADGTSSSRTRTVRTRGSSDKENARPLSEAEIKEFGTEFRLAKGPIAKRLIFGEMLKALTPENAELMRENIAHLPSDSPEFREFHYAWGTMAGKVAIDHGAETPKRDMAASLAGWASADPAAAMAYFDSLDENAKNGGNYMKWGAVFGLADADPNLATEFAAQRLASGDKEAHKMINIVADKILDTGDHEIATAWAKNIPEGDLQNSAYQKIGYEYARDDPEGAAEWATNLPDGEAKDRAMGSTFHAWAGRSPEAAAEAISNLPTDQRDSARYGYATRVVHDNPAMGVEWAAAIDDPATRNKALVDTGRVYLRRDKDGATAWLQNSGLSAEDQARITGKK